MNFKKILIGVATGALMLESFARLAFAAPSHPTFGTFVNAGDVPSGANQVIDVTYKVTNDEDSGFVGFWALDSFNKHLQVWRVPDGSFYAVARYDGNWETFQGALSPQNGVVEGNDGSGTFQGGYTATFTAPSCSTVKGNIGSFDFGGTKADVLLGTYGAGQTGPTTVFDAYAKYCPGYNTITFNESPWGWTYHNKSQSWNNFNYGSSGDIIIP